VRYDWLVEVLDVATCRGVLTVDATCGRTYIAKATGLGFTNFTAFTGGERSVISVKIPNCQDCGISR